MFRKKEERILLALSTFLLCTPLQTFAQLKVFAGRVVAVLNAAVALIIGLAVFFFAIGIIRFINNAGDEKSRGEGKQMMVWGTLAIFVMVAVWGIVAIIRTTFFT